MLTWLVCTAMSVCRCRFAELAITTAAKMQVELQVRQQEQLDHPAAAAGEAADKCEGGERVKAAAATDGTPAAEAAAAAAASVAAQGTDARGVTAAVTPVSSTAASANSVTGPGPGPAAAATAACESLSAAVNMLYTEHFVELLAYRVALASLQLQDKLSKSSHFSSSSSSST
jgi:hypothetical protein